MSRNFTRIDLVSMLEKYYLGNRSIPSKILCRNISQVRHQKHQLQRLTDKVAVVTASTDGIGFGIVQRLAREGGKVVVSSRKMDNVNRAVDRLRTEGFPDVIGVKCHVSSAEDRQNLFAEAVKQFGGVDILVSNAAVNPAQVPVLETSERAWDKIFDVNVKSSFLLAQEAKALMLQRGGGSIVFMSSIAAYFNMPTLGAYSVSKVALLGLTKAAAFELGPHNIRVNCVAPGLIKTNFSKNLYVPEGALEDKLQHVPMNKLGEVDDVSGIVAFLVSEDASYITGEIIVASGGIHSHL